MSKEYWEKLDRRARSTIRICLEYSVILNVSRESTTKELWDKLGNLYQSKSLVNKLFLQKKLYHLRMEDGDSVTEHLNAFNTLVSQLGYVNITIAEEYKCITLLCSLPDSWDNLVVEIGSTTQYTLKYEDVVASLLSKEMRRISMDGHNIDALFVRGRTQDRNPIKPSRWRSKSIGRSKSPRKSLRKCWKCGKTGHYKKYCKSKKVEKPKGSDSTSSIEAKKSTEGGDVYLAYTSTHVDHDVWLINSGASYHMTPGREWFSDYEKYDGGDVFLGDDSTTKILGRGRVKLLLKDGRIRTLPGVLHIPKLAKSLISVSNLDDVGVDTVFGKNTCKMVRGEMVLMRGVWCETLYKLLGITYTNGCNSYVVLDGKTKEDKTNIVPEKKTMLWHQILGHIGEKGLRALHGKGMAEGMSNFTLDFDFCEHCIYGKHNRVRFPSGSTRAKGILELIHSEVFGPVPIPSLGKYMYYVSFIDDFSRNTWIYFLRNKFEVFDKFKEFKALVGNQIKKKIKVLRTYNCGELCKNEFEEFYKKSGIERQKTTS
jgi:hypothetical protein